MLSLNGFLFQGITKAGYLPTVGALILPILVYSSPSSEQRELVRYR